DLFEPPHSEYEFKKHPREVSGHHAQLMRIFEMIVVNGIQSDAFDSPWKVRSSRCDFVEVRRPAKGSGSRLPIQDERDGRGRALVFGLVTNIPVLITRICSRCRRSDQASYVFGSS